MRDYVHRDRNHPSVIMWSIGNEIPEQGKPEGRAEAHRLTSFFHQEDPTRPTTSAFNNWTDAIKNKLTDEVDVQGFNYRPMDYEKIMKEHPTWAVYGSETASCVSSRGVYHLPLAKYEKDPSLQLTSYDLIAPMWAYCPDPEFAAQERFPNLLGEFVWTGFDYIGEPTPYFSRADDPKDWPARSSYFGMVDLAGFPKDRYYLTRASGPPSPWCTCCRTGTGRGTKAKDPGDVLLQRRRSGTVAQRQIAGPQAALRRTGGAAGGRQDQPEHKYSSKFRLMWQCPTPPAS